MVGPALSLRLAFALTVVLASFAATIVTSQTQPLRKDSCAWVVFVDDLHINFTATGRMRMLVRTILTSLVEEDDVVAVRTSGFPSPGTEFKKKREMVTAVGELSGNGLRPYADPGVGQAVAVTELKHRTHASLSRAIAAVAVLGQLDSRHRALLYISNGYPFDMNSLIEGRALAGVARQSGVKVFAIDARVLDASAQPAAQAREPDDHIRASRESLRVLSVQSGGFAILDGDDMAAAFERIASAIRR